MWMNLNVILLTHIIKYSCFRMKSKYGVLAASKFALNAVALFFILPLYRESCFPRGKGGGELPYEKVRRLVNQPGHGSSFI